jgi:hypothetical protein
MLGWAVMWGEVLGCCWATPGLRWPASAAKVSLLSFVLYFLFCIFCFKFYLNSNFELFSLLQVFEIVKSYFNISSIYKYFGSI